MSQQPESIVFEGKTLPIWQREQLESLKREQLRRRALDIRDALGADRLPPLPMHAEAAISWILEVQDVIMSNADPAANPAPSVIVLINDLRNAEDVESQMELLKGPTPAQRPTVGALLEVLKPTAFKDNWWGEGVSKVPIWENLSDATYLLTLVSDVLRADARMCDNILGREGGQLQKPLLQFISGAGNKIVFKNGGPRCEKVQVPVTSKAAYLLAEVLVQGAVMDSEVVTNLVGRLVGNDYGCPREVDAETMMDALAKLLEQPDFRESIESQPGVRSLLARNTNDPVELRRLVAEGADLLSFFSPDWKPWPHNGTPLHLAIFFGRHEIVETLLELLEQSGQLQWNLGMRCDPSVVESECHYSDMPPKRKRSMPNPVTPVELASKMGETLIENLLLEKLAGSCSLGTSIQIPKCNLCIHALARLDTDTHCRACQKPPKAYCCMGARCGYGLCKRCFSQKFGTI